MKTRLLSSLMVAGLFFTACSKDDDANNNSNGNNNQNNTGTAICGGFFEANQGTSNLTAGPVNSNFDNNFTQGNAYEVVILKTAIYMLPATTKRMNSPRV